MTAEFYKYFWEEIRETLHNVFTEAIKGGSLSPSQRTGIITLLPKQGKDCKHLKNWRPITLLNIDYKIYTHILKNQGCYVRYFSAKSALRAFNLRSALECVKSALYLLCFHKI